MGSQSRFLLLSTLLLTLLFASMAATSAPSKLIEDICTSTSKSTATTFNDCVAALSLDPKSASADLLALAKITLRLGLSNATDTETYTKNLKSSSPPNLQKPLKTCLSWYDASRNSFRSAFEELEDDPMTANYDAKIAGDDVAECEAELARDKVAIPAITQRNNYLRMYSNIGDVVTDRLY